MTPRRECTEAVIRSAHLLSAVDSRQNLRDSIRGAVSAVCSFAAPRRSETRVSGSDTEARSSAGCGIAPAGMGYGRLTYDGLRTLRGGALNSATDRLNTVPTQVRGSQEEFENTFRHYGNAAAHISCNYLFFRSRRQIAWLSAAIRGLNRPGGHNRRCSGRADG